MMLLLTVKPNPVNKTDPLQCTLQKDELYWTSIASSKRRGVHRCQPGRGLWPFELSHSSVVDCLFRGLLFCPLQLNIQFIVYFWHKNDDLSTPLVMSVCPVPDSSIIIIINIIIVVVLQLSSTSTVHLSRTFIDSSMQRHSVGYAYDVSR